VLIVEVGRAQRQPFRLELAGQEVLAQIRPVVRPLVFGADEQDAAYEALLPERFGRGRGRGARADDDELARIGVEVARIHGHGATALGLLGTIHVHVVAVHAYAERGDAVERRRLQEVAVPHMEGSLVPRAQQSRPVERALGQRPAPMRAAGRGSIEAAFDSGQQHLLAADEDGRHLAVGQVLLACDAFLHRALLSRK
jgi:hypothetical protein